MSIGTNIKNLREDRKLTQEQVAEAMGISFQAVSSWERDEYKPDTEKLIKLAEVFDVSVSAIAEEKQKAFKTKETIYDWKHMKTYVKTTARNLQLSDTLKAIDFAVAAHEGQTRKKAPLTQHLGISPDNFLIEPYIAKGELKPGDQYLLCSDGLTDMVSEGEICKILVREENSKLNYT